MEAYAWKQPLTIFPESDETYAGLKTYLGTKEALHMEHGDLERELSAKGHELIRQLLQAHLNLRAPGEAEGAVSDAEGVAHEQPRDHSRELETLFGTVVVNRLGYGRPGADSLHPLDAALNLPGDRYSMGVRRRIAEEAAKGSFEDAAEEVERTTAAHVPKRQAEELTVRAAQDFEAFYESRRETALVKDPAGKILAISFDGKGVVMRKEDLREQTRKAYTVAPYPRVPEDVIRSLAGKAPSKPEPLQPRRPRPEGKRVMASLEWTMEEVIAELFADAQHRDPRHGKLWVALVDGNPTQIRLIAEEAKCQQVAVTTVVDFIHVAEYVWRAGTAFNKEGSLNWRPGSNRASWRSSRGMQAWWLRPCAGVPLGATSVPRPACRWTPARATSTSSNPTSAMTITWPRDCRSPRA